MANIAQTLRDARRRLAGVHDAQLSAELLLARALGCTRSALYSAPEKTLEPGEATEFDRLIDARSSGHPLGYLLGQAEFWSLSLSISPAVLVPRPETELVVETALEVPRPPHARIADLGTGSGAIAAAIALECTDAQVVATDRSAAALAIAKRNVERLGLGGRIELMLANWLDPFRADGLDIVLSNPPYIGESERPGLPPELMHEPPSALFSGQDGLGALSEIARGAVCCLRSGGTLILEHGAAQGHQVRAMLHANGYHDVETLRDLAGHERVTRATNT